MASDNTLNTAQKIDFSKIEPALKRIQKTYKNAAQLERVCGLIDTAVEELRRHGGGLDLRSDLGSLQICHNKALNKHHFSLDDTSFPENKNYEDNQANITLALDGSSFYDDGYGPVFDASVVALIKTDEAAAFLKADDESLEQTKIALEQSINKISGQYGAGIAFRAIVEIREIRNSAPQVVPSDLVPLDLSGTGAKSTAWTPSVEGGTGGADQILTQPYIAIPENVVTPEPPLAPLPETISPYEPVPQPIPYVSDYCRDIIENDIKDEIFREAVLDIVSQYEENYGSLRAAFDGINFVTTDRGQIEQTRLYNTALYVLAKLEASHYLEGKSEKDIAGFKQSQEWHYQNIVWHNENVLSSDDFLQANYDYHDLVRESREVASKRDPANFTGDEVKKLWNAATVAAEIAENSQLPLHLESLKKDVAHWAPEQRKLKPKRFFRTMFIGGLITVAVGAVSWMGIKTLKSKPVQKDPEIISQTVPKIETPTSTPVEEPKGLTGCAGNPKGEFMQVMDSSGARGNACVIGIPKTGTCPDHSKVVYSEDGRLCALEAPNQEGMK